MLVSVIALNLGKPQIALFLTIVIGIALLLSLFKRKRPMETLSLVSLLFACIGSYAFFSEIYYGLDKEYLGSPVRQWQIFLDVNTLLTWFLPVFLVLILRNFPFFGWTQLTNTESRLFTFRVFFSVLCTAVLYSILHDANAIRHTISVSLVLGSIASSSFVRQQLLIPGRRLLAVIVSCGFISGFVTQYLLESLKIVGNASGGLVRSALVNYPTQLHSLTIVLIATVAFAKSMLLNKRDRQNRSRHIQAATNALSIFVVLSLSSNIGIYASWSARHQLRGTIYSALNLSGKDLGPRDDPKVPVSDWIRVNTNPDSILAHGTMCIYMPNRILRPTGSLDSECGEINTSSWVTSMSHRRTYLDRPFNAIIDKSDSENAQLRYRNSVLFATEALPSAMEDFERVGVDYFVIDLAQTELRLWEPYATIVYRDDNYFVLRMNY
jgi:hypothetical protein